MCAYTFILHRCLVYMMCYWTMLHCRLQLQSLEQILNLYIKITPSMLTELLWF
ncbi:hypothetical protein EXN66_Car018027 [Channa argus]|uniref:Uncharacterized protein n=1 Tax=Channa argus TaxID=215402 RepID=A0A6G1QIX5_CHAAH|nr:hypothetical protein EXN66_Car018027 [Channa argus]